MAEGGAFVFPGYRVCESSGATTGVGTYEHGGHVYASLLGYVSYHTHGDGQKIVEVAKIKPSGNIPAVNDIVLCKVVEVDKRHARVQIMTSESGFLASPYEGVIRKENVSAVDIDAVAMHDSFRAQDIVRAQVISLGDARRFYLSTAGETLGVVVAYSGEGNAMVAKSWQTMMDTINGKEEKRKVARVTHTQMVT
eukprot:Clim_evm69s236 gene=Clim_evmTU69s236